MDQQPDDGDQDREPHQRQGDAAEAVEQAPAPSTRAACVELRRDALQPGEKQDHREGAVAPHGVEDKRGHRRLGIGEYRDVAEAERAERDAHEAGVLREDPTQQQRADEHRDHVRHERHRADGDAPAAVALEMQRQAHPDGQGEDQREGREDQRRGRDWKTIGEVSTRR